MNFGGVEAVGGQIVTIKCHEDNSLVAELVEEPGSGKVLVVDGGASMRCGLLGDNLAKKAVDNGWQGIVVNGCIRDAAAIARLSIGIRALNTHPLKSGKRGTGQENLPVTFAGVTFRPGEYLYADEDGLVVSAASLI